MIRKYLKILKINTVNTYHLETAYLATKWTNMLSTLIYTAVQIAFVEVLYGSVQTIASYTKPEMLFLVFIGQLNFYLVFGVFSFTNMTVLAESINKGDLDLLLTKPVPALFYTSLRRISFVHGLRDMLPPLIGISLVIDWAVLGLTLTNVLIGALIFTLGLVASNALLFFLVLPAFWYGESNNTVNIGWSISGEDIPYEGMPTWFKGTFIYIMPVFISSAVATSAILGKTSPLFLLFMTATITVAIKALQFKAWHWGLKHYTSASS